MQTLGCLWVGVLISKGRNLYLEFIFTCHENLNLYGIVELKCEKIVPAVLEATFHAKYIVRYTSPCT